MNQHPITDHALIRYCERAKSIDMDWIRDHIATPDVLAAINSGAKSLTKDGLVYKIQGGRVVTISEARSPEAYKSTKRQRRKARNRHGHT